MAEHLAENLTNLAENLLKQLNAAQFMEFVFSKSDLIMEQQWAVTITKPIMEQSLAATTTKSHHKTRAGCNTPQT